jgi:hypothetical protein
VPRSKASPFKRRPTRYRGISYRLKSDGTKTYSVYHAGRYWPVVGGEAEARAQQAELRCKAARGERPLLPSRQTFAAVAEQWFESKPT